jgi:hypothetical protein
MSRRKSCIRVVIHKLSSPHYRYIRKMRRGDRLPLTQHILINVYWNKYGLIQTDATNDIVVLWNSILSSGESVSLSVLKLECGDELWVSWIWWVSRSSLPFQCTDVTYRVYIVKNGSPSTINSWVWARLSIQITPDTMATASRLQRVVNTYLFSCLTCSSLW